MSFNRILLQDKKDKKSKRNKGLISRGLPRYDAPILGRGPGLALEYYTHYYVRQKPRNLCAFIVLFSICQDIRVMFQ